MMLKHFELLQFLIEEIPLFIARRVTIIQVHLDCHAECEEQLVLLKQTPAHVRVKGL